MKKKHPLKKVKEIDGKQEHFHETHDQKILKAFCEDVHYEEVDFSFWKFHNDSLDIVIHISITKAEATSGGEKVVSYSRVVYSATQKSRSHSIKEAVQQLISWPTFSVKKFTINIAGLGDVRDEKKGNLKVILNIS